MKRHPAFQDLSRDHFVALNRALQVVRAAEGHPRARPFEHARFQLQDLWEHDGLRQHFEEEEADLVPVLRANGADGLAQSLLDEHAALRAGFGALGHAGPVEAAATARSLMAHVRWEEDTVFEWLQAHLPEAELHALLLRSQGFRRANGRPVQELKRA